MEKVKSRFSSLDVHAIVNELEPSIVGSHLQNIYDINSRVYLLKFTKRDAKVLLLVESGVRIHSTRFDRENPNVLPSAFVAKLRKHLRERRLTRFEQLGFDRIVHFEFGHDNRPEQTFHLFLELYSMGNIILTDYNFKVISLIREVKLVDKITGESSKILSIGSTFDVTKFQTLKNVQKVFELEKDFTSNGPIRSTLRSLLPMFSPDMIEFCLNERSLSGKEPAISLPKQEVGNLLKVASELAEKIENNQLLFKGALHTFTKDHCRKAFDFSPTLSNDPNPNIAIVEFPTFNEAVDEYFYQMEEAKAKDRQNQTENAVTKKFDAIKKEQQSRIESLEDSMKTCLCKAQLIEGNIRPVEEAILVINTGLANDMSWSDLEELVNVERQKGRPIAQIISKLKLYSSLVELKLQYGGREEEECHLVDVDIRLGGHANANRYYEMRKAAQEKLCRTKAAFEQAMKSAETKVRADSRNDRKKVQSLIPKRKTMWFEKFNWFISSDSYLVISGKDMHQNEYIVKRLLKSGDAYIHADLTGASSVIVKNHRKAPEGGTNQILPPLPHRTLVEAGAFSLCFSKAWEAKIVISAWWVNAEQVSKTAPTGEYLTTGSFIIRGKKNFLPPAQLALGFGFMFLLDEESTARRRQARHERELQRDTLGEPSDSTSSNYKSNIEMDDRREEEFQMIISKGVSALDLDKGAKKQVPTPLPCAKVETPPPCSKKGVKNPEQVRGKHGKQKKIKEKYKDQDEEERAIRLALLCSKPKNATKEPTRSSSAVSAISRVPQSLPRPGLIVKAQINQTATENAIDEEDTLGVDELSILDSLTGTPTLNDVTVGIVAVAAPFMVVQHYKYRVKLLPGNMKRGTAAKTALSLIFAETKGTITSHEKNLIKSIPDIELNSTMPGKVRIAGSGVELSKVKKALKKNK